MSHPPMSSQPAQQHPLVGPIGQALAAAVPPGWRQLRVEHRAVGLYVETDVVFIGPDGVPRPVQPPAVAVQLLGWLRAGMYQAGLGAWFSATLVIDPATQPYVSFVFDQEPRWRGMPSPLGFQDELRFFPRAEQYIPDWLRWRAGLPPAAPAMPTMPAAAPMPPAVPPAMPAAPPAAPVPATPWTPPPARPYAVRPPTPEPPVAPAGSPVAPAGRSAHDGDAHVMRMARVYERLDDAGRPFASWAPVAPTEHDLVLDYLVKAPVVLAARGYAPDQFDPERRPAVPMAFRTDGTWVWVGAVPYYLREHGLPPEPDLLAHIRARDFALPEVSEEAKRRAVDTITST